MIMQDLSKRPDRRSLYPRLASAVALAAVCSIALAAVPPNTTSSAASPPRGTTATSAVDIDQSKEELIRALVKLTESRQVQAVFSQQLVDRVSSAISMFGPTLNPQTMQIVQQQTQAVVSEHIADGDALYSVLAPIYEKHFNLIELNQLVNFYQSPLGQKLVRVSPQLLTETLDLGSQWGLSLVPEIVKRVQARVDDQNAEAASSNATP